ncbi:hypothetical protein [Nannocystis sp. SCPEA4]|uniref:hypothetical protein n=1 Tax=Nannocystis sp. SCPEA4 TaxID=2996787 RepID=UPI00226E5F6C|nr:hypothetical protein [Nannocystis sp. SCPEA4]MCY1054071.1 hypothetical protein [Nannocystis sp. SCPEA4]
MMRASAARGRRQVIGVINTCMTFHVATIVLFVSVRGGERLPQQIVRTLVTAGLCYALYRGARWARWTTAVLYAPAGALGLFLLATDHGTVNSMTLFQFAMATSFLSCAVVLVLSRDVAAYFRGDAVVPSPPGQPRAPHEPGPG